MYRVETGSMEDGIRVGDYILITKQDTYEVGDVVTFVDSDDTIAPYMIEYLLEDILKELSLRENQV